MGGVVGLTVGMEQGAIVSNFFGGLAIGYISAVVFGPISAIARDRLASYGEDSPRLILRSAVSAVAAALVYGTIAFVVFENPWVGFEKSSWIVSIKSIDDCSWVAALAAFYWGGRAVITHYCLRFFICARGYGPWRLARFLDYVATKAIMRKVGSAYEFYHPKIRDALDSRDKI